MSQELGVKRPGDEPFESETEIEDKQGQQGIIGTLHTPLWGQYCEDDLTGMVVRGLNFMSDKKKIDCAPPIYKLMHADIFRTAKDQERAAHFAAHPLSWASLRWERKQARDAAAAAAAAPAAAAVVEAPAAAASAAADADGLAASMGAVEVSASAAAPLPAAVASPSNCPTPANSPAANGSAGTSPQPQASNAGLNAATAGMMSDPLAPLIVINFLIPGSSGTSMNLVLYFARRIKPAEQLRKHKEHKEAQHQKAHHHGEGHGAHSHPPPLTKADSAKRGHHGSSHKLHTGTPFSTSPFGQPTGPAAAAAGFSHPVPNRDAACYYASEFESDDFPHDIERIAAFDSLLLKFLNGTDEFRDGRLKIVPRVAEGSWVVKKSIGRVPAILGKKVKQFYYRNEERNYIEIDADLGTSMVAGRIIQMIKGTCRGLKVDLSFLLQGEGAGELPESLLGGIRMIHVDLDKITFLEDNNKKNPPMFDF